jgi:hypothetical protein
MTEKPRRRALAGVGDLAQWAQAGPFRTKKQRGIERSADLKYESRTCVACIYDDKKAGDLIGRIKNDNK